MLCDQWSLFFRGKEPENSVMSPNPHVFHSKFFGLVCSLALLVFKEIACFGWVMWLFPLSLLFMQLDHCSVSTWEQQQLLVVCPVVYLICWKKWCETSERVRRFPSPVICGLELVKSSLLNHSARKAQIKETDSVKHLMVSACQLFCFFLANAGKIIILQTMALFFSNSTNTLDLSILVCSSYSVMCYNWAFICKYFCSCKFWGIKKAFVCLMSWLYGSI